MTTVNSDTRRYLFAQGQAAAHHALLGPLSQGLSPTLTHPAQGDREHDEDGCPTCGDASCGLWRDAQAFEAALPDAPRDGDSSLAIALLDQPATARWAARWLRRGAREYLRTASAATGEDCTRLAQRSLFFRGTGNCQKRYVTRA